MVKKLKDEQRESFSYGSGPTEGSSQSNSSYLTSNESNVRGSGQGQPSGSINSSVPIPGTTTVLPAITGPSIGTNPVVGSHSGTTVTTPFVYSSPGNYPPPQQLGNYSLPHGPMQLVPPISSTQHLDQNHHLDSSNRTRMRVSKACDRCRTQKIKCSASFPCEPCKRNKKECTYSAIYNTTVSGSNLNGGSAELRDSSQFPINKRQRVAVEPFGLPVVSRTNEREYISHLENRVHYLESLLSTSTNETFKPPSTKEPENPELEKLLISPSSKWRFSRRHQNLLIIELCKSMYENLSEDSKKEVTLPRTQYFGWNMSGCNYINSEELPKLPDLVIYPDEYVEYYFKEINPLLAILHETVFKEQYMAYDKLLREQFSLNKNVNDRDSKTNQTRLFSAILYLVCALSIRFMEMQKPKGPSMEKLKLEEKLFRYGYKVVSILSFEWESFELIQSWLLIALYLRISHRQTSSFHALGQAVTMTKAMGIGQDNPKLHVSTPYERLKAKRIFWCVYTFDRLFGLQTGRYSGLRDEDLARQFPTFDFLEETKRDDWITLPAFALIHIARISNFVHTSVDDNPELVKYQQINKELVQLHDWFNVNGFRNLSLFSKTAEPDVTGQMQQKQSGNVTISSLVKVQVKLHYYDLVLCFHGKILFNYIGRRISSHGLKIEMVLDACHGILEVLDKTNKAGLLYTPWYLVLLLLFNTGVNAVTLINSGIFVDQARGILKGTIRLLTILKKSPVRNEQGKIIIKERFKMVKECLWALKTANRILSLRLQEDIKALDSIGTDHGSSDVNKAKFVQLGLNNEVREGSSKQLENSKDEFNDVFEKQLHRGEEPIESSSNQNNSNNNKNINSVDNSTPGSDINNGGIGSVDSNGPRDPNSASADDVDNLFSNLKWFDQWMDFNYDF